MAYSDEELLARLIECEAGGEGETGMRAVATVVMNRVNVSAGEYARIGKGSLRNILYQQGQFQCARDYVQQNLYNMNPGALEYEIARWALSGGRLGAVDGALWFFNPYSDTCPAYFPTGVGRFVTHIGRHCFYSPTDAYYTT